MDALLEEQYFVWLYTIIADPELRNPSRTHWHLARQLHQKEFVWFVPHDDNRLEDGRALRYYFKDEIKPEDIGPEWMSYGCSMLEMLVALAKRLAFQTDESWRSSFWHILDNVDLAHLVDRRYDVSVQMDVDVILDTIIWRTYSDNGVGGLFPLKETDRDQRKVEIWSQMNEYITSEF